VRNQNEDQAEQHLTDQDPKTLNKFTDRDLERQEAPNGKDCDDLFAVEHPLDLSFTKDINYGKRGGLTGYASDNDKRGVTKQSIDDFKSSIISSDESIVAKINQQKPIDERDGSDEKYLSSSKKRSGKLVTSRDVPGRLKRMLTSDFKDKSKMNDSQSTYLGYNPSFRQQIDILSNLQPNGKESTRKAKAKMVSTLDLDDKTKLRGP